MSELRRGLAIAAVALLLPYCGYRERGLEVTLDVTVARDAGMGTLDVERIELLSCPDAAPQTAWLDELGIAVAHAHDQPTAIGPIGLTLPSGHASSTLRLPPGSYCDVRIHLGSSDTPALMMAQGDASERETVLRLLDASGVPTRLTLASAPDRATIAIALGSFSDDDAPAHALSGVIDGARATLIAP